MIMQIIYLYLTLYFMKNFLRVFAHIINLLGIYFIRILCVYTGNSHRRFVVCLT